MKAITLVIAMGMMAAAPGMAAAEGPANFGGNGVAWEVLYLGGSMYYSQVNQDNLAKDWATPAGEVRFTNPGNAEGNASGNSAIQFFPCPGTQVYPRKK